LSFSIDTLQDFVLNILNDEAAKAAYDADPLGALKDAGLADLTPADVQEVLPLVADCLPTDLSDLPVDLPSVVPSLDDLPVDLPELGDLPSLPTLETPLGDVTAVVDGAAGAAGLGLDTALLDSTTSGLLHNAAEHGAPTLSTHAESLVGDLAAGVKLAPEEFGGSVAGTSELADLGAGLVGHSGGDVGGWAGVDTVAGDIAGGVLAGPDGVAVAAETPLGSVDLDSDGDFSVNPANPSDLLDIDHIGTTGDAVAGTVAHYVAAGAGALAGGVAAGGENLGGYLTGGAAPIGDHLESTTDTVSDGIQHGGDALSEHLSNLPTTGELPLDQLPELPQLPDLPDIDSDDLPDVGDVTDHLPLDLPSVQLPDTSGVTDLVANNPVTDAVDASPVGGLVDDVTGHLPRLGGLPTDLDLGL
jgi:hypothetical protein